MTGRVSYNTFYKSWHEAMSELTDEQYGRLARALNDYCFFEIEPEELTGIEKMLFVAVKPTINSSVDNKTNGEKGGAPKGNKNAVKNNRRHPPLYEKIIPHCKNETSEEEEDVEVDEDVDVEEEEELGASAPFDGSDEPPPTETDALELSKMLLSTHRNEFPDYLSGKDDRKTVERWAEDIEKLIRIDKKPPETIRRVILWVKTPGNFWFHNIESGKKLREKFERLYGQMLDGIKATSPPKHRIEADYVPVEDIANYFTEAG